MKLPDIEPPGIHYPESDGKPMAESDTHRDVMVYLIESAKYRFREERDIYVSGNIFVYYVEGDPRKSVSPDFLFVRGVPGMRRRTYKTWEEGKGLDVTIEVTSRKTHKEDLGKKLEIYDKRLGIQDYFLYDPEGIRFEPQLRGFRRVEGRLRPIHPEQRADGSLVLSSEVLRLELHARGTFIRWVDPVTGKALPSGEEIRDRLHAESGRADAAEAEAAKLRIELERLRQERDG